MVRVKNLKQYCLFNIINILGNHKNFKTCKHLYKTELSFKLVLNIISILKMKNIDLVSKTFSIFFYNFLKNYNLGFKKKFKRFNNLKNNFKLFVYLLYKNSLLSNSFKDKNIIKPDFIISLINYNNYYPYFSIQSNNTNLSDSIFYNFLYKDDFKSSSFILINKFRNYTYLRSNKRKRFKHKQSEKLAILRENLDLVIEKPFRLKFYHKFYDYKRLHSYWNKEEFLQKKFKYFNPNRFNYSINKSSDKHLYLLHFFYKFRKFRKFTNKSLLFKKKWFINFWLQAKVKKLKFSSYKLHLQKKKTEFKFYNNYLNSIYRLNNKKQSISYLKNYKYYLLNINNRLNNYFLNLDLNINDFLNINKNNIFKKGVFIKYLNSYNYFKKMSLYNNNHLYSSSAKIKIFKKNNLPIKLMWKKKRNLSGQIFFFNTNTFTKFFLLQQFKRDKSFRIKFKYIKWLNTQKILKNWKFIKFLSYKRVKKKKFKKSFKNILELTKKTSVEKTFNQQSNFSIISSAPNKINKWLNFNTLLKIKKRDKINSLISSVETLTTKYVKNFSFYKSNKVLNFEYAYWNIFKDKKNNYLNQIKYSPRRKGLNKLSKILFKRSWNIVKKKFKNNNKYKRFHNLVPIYNYFFIKKVVFIYKKLFISKLLFSNILNKKPSYSLIKSYNKLNIINRIYNTRFIDKKYGFKKRKERNLFYKLKKYKNLKTLLIGKLSKLDNFFLKKNNKINNFNILHYKIKLNLLQIKKIINKLQILLKKVSKRNFKKNLFSTAGLKIINFKKSSFINFLQHFSRVKKKKTLFKSFLYFIDLKNKKYLNNFLGLNNIYVKKSPKNLNSLRLVKSKNIIKKYNILSNFKNNKNLLNSLVLNKLKKNNFLIFNFKLNFLLKKDYFNFLKLFKYFNFYRVINHDSDYYLGYGKLINYLHINNENIFSFCNFFMYNFLNYSSWEKENLPYSNNNYVGVNKDNVNALKLFKAIDFSEKKKKKTSNISINEDVSDSYSIYNYDIVKKKFNFFNKIINNKHFSVKYNSLLLLNPLISIYNKNLFNKNKKILLNIKKYDILKLNFSKLLIINWFIYGIGNNESYVINSCFKKLYCNLLYKYNNI